MDKNIKIKTEYIKLSDLLKYASIVSSGADAKYLVADGKVLVDGVICLQRGRKIYPGMRVSGFYDNSQFILKVEGFAVTG